MSDYYADAFRFMITRSDDWTRGVWWQKQRARFQCEAEFDNLRFDLENRLIKFESINGCCSLDESSPYRKYDHSPVQAFAKLRSEQIFSHVTDAELVAAILERRHYGSGTRIEDGSPRVSIENVRGVIRNQYGVRCQCCFRIKGLRSYFVGQGDLSEPNDFGEECPFSPEDLDDTPWHQWLSCGWCDECVAKQRISFVGREAKRSARERIFIAEVKRRRAARIALDEASIEARRKAKQDAIESRRRKRIEMEAAYEMVRDMGLLDRIQQQPEGSNEAGSPG